ncbi:MAG: rhomboid family intramembrane serine protease [Saprospiraceae bacterium]|nr:rhomboid family intramembrane serine protease [Saprospiraceae bacterium]MCB9324307.1 rhomboid family intramembrane serine protease [Lewinellaceae bacterium]
MGLRITDVVKNLLIINILMFVGSNVLTSSEIFDANRMLALYYPNSPLFQPYQIVTHFFMHGGFTHILFNMFALVMFGSPLEALWGGKKFLFFYFFSALGAVALSFGIHYFEYAHFLSQLTPEQIQLFAKEGYDALSKGYNYENGSLAELNLKYYSYNYVPMVGASGAIFGLLLAFGMKFPNVELMLIFLPIPIKAKYFIPILMVFELTLGIAQFSWDNIAHFAHLGGALFGFLLILYWRKFDSGFQH